MTNEMTYDKKYHFLDSFSVFMDISKNKRSSCNLYRSGIVNSVTSG